MTVEIGKIQKETSPNPFCLITSRKENGKTNIMALSWWTYVSNKPAIVAVCLSNRGYSGELIRRSGEFGLCLPDESLMQASMKCGRCSGRECDKPEEFGIGLSDARTISAKLVTKSHIALECKVIKIVEVNDHDMFLAEVVEAHIHPEYRHLYAFNGYRELRTSS